MVKIFEITKNDLIANKSSQKSKSSKDLKINLNREKLSREKFKERKQGK